MPKPGRISINLSLKQLRQAEFLTRYRSVFDDAGVSPSNFELEITETTLMTEAGRMVRLLDELHAMGLHLSIDDFGTGYSSLSALQQFPVGTLKIDQSFVRHATVSKEDATLVRTIIEMGKNLDLKVVAEGIESQQQLDFLRSRDCHYGQGRLFGEPMTAEDFLALLLAQSRGESNYGDDVRGRLRQAAARLVLCVGGDRVEGLPGSFRHGTIECRIQCGHHRRLPVLGRALSPPIP